MWSGEFRHRVDKYDQLRKSKDSKSPRKSLFDESVRSSHQFRSQHTRSPYSLYSYDRCTACSLKIDDTLTPRFTEDYCNSEVCRLIKVQ